MVTTEARVKMESLEFQRFFDACLTKFESCQNLLNKISHGQPSYLVGEITSLNRWSADALVSFLTC